MGTYKRIIRSVVMRALAIMLAFTTSALAQDATAPIPRHICGPSILATGIASVYSDSLEGKKTANGELMDMSAFTAAHPTVAFGRVVEVTDAKTKKVIHVRINDRGPYTGARIIDLTRAGHVALGHPKSGIYKVTLKLCK